MTQIVMNGTVESSDASNVTDEIIFDSSSTRNDPDAVEQGREICDNKDSLNFTISIYKKRKFSIYKPLIPLKLAFFFWYGASAAVSTFILVFFKQRGITLTELSIVYVSSPVVQFLGTTISGIIADKIGRSKPVLVGNLIIIIVIVVCMLALPRINLGNCDSQLVNMDCHNQEFDSLIAKSTCEMNTDVIELRSCNVTCPGSIKLYCNEQSLICEILEGNESYNLSLSVHVNFAYILRNKCYYNVASMSYKNTSYPRCNVPHEMYCNISCLMNSDYDCSDRSENNIKYLIMNMTLLILYFAASTNSYRCFDATAMCLVREHNSDFGRERTFAIAGALILNPFAGYLVDLSTPAGDEKNYDTVFYIFIGFICLLICILYFLEVHIRPPGKNMWKKSFHLLKNPDNIAFALVLIVLGSAFGFSKNFTSWYLEEMNTPGFLLGLINSMSALYGLPFLFTSNWWVKKFGTTQIFILGLLGYVASGTGYSLLYDPWLALLIEATAIVTYHLLWVSVIVRSYSIAPEGLTATVIAVAGGIHYSVGRGLGGFVGGLTMQAFGGRTAYKVMALTCLVSAVLYAAYFYIRRTCFPETQDLRVQEGTVNATYENEEVPKEIYVLKTKL